MGSRLIAVVLVVGAVRGFALTPEELEFFERKVRPVLTERCYECHSATARKVKGNLLLDSRAGILKGGDSGPALVAGQPEKSLIVKAVRYNDEDLQMPPKHRLDPQEIANLEQWVKMGAPDPREATAAAAALLAKRTDTGSVSFKRPSVGSWVSYGLGTENQNLPSFVVLAPELPYAGSQVWSSDFLPGCHQGTRVLAGAEPIPDLNRRSPSAKVQKLELDLLERFNRKHQQTRPADPSLAARMKSFETAFGMQMEMPEVLDLSRESDATLKLYGLERGSTKGFAWQCLVARRMAERGVRFIELIDVGSHSNWDAHGDMSTHGPLAKNVDQAIAGLLKDLKSRDMLKDTLVVWTTEFGRTPQTDGPKGRSHHARAYTSWLAGGGVKGGITYGKTDDYGRDIAENAVHVHDFNATILHLLGFDHEKLTFRHAGRDFRLTDVHGNVVKALLA